MSGAHAAETRRREHRSPWVHRLLTAAPIVPMTAAWLLVLGQSASAPESQALSGASEVAIAATRPVTVDATPLTAVPNDGVATNIRDGARASADAIPDTALAAYQRAATVINATDESCHVPWQLIAAIGKVESNHGRYAGSVPDKEGVVQPSIIGIRLDGSRNTTRIVDTDAGVLDGDPKFDRAVGPMQFIPSTWALAGVDADGDGRRNPQDLDDAALGAAVYLCTGPEDLSTKSGQRSAVHRYNHSKAYVDLVLGIFDAYQAGNFWAVNPTSTPDTTPVFTRPAPPPPEATPTPTLIGLPVPNTSPPAPTSGGPDAPSPDPDSPIDPEPSSPPTPSPTPSPTPTDPAPSEQPTEAPSEAELLCTEAGITAADDLELCVSLVDEWASEQADHSLPTLDELLVLLTDAGIVVPDPDQPS